MFQIWDTAGTERFKSIVPFYLRDADVAIVAYDITERNTFENINQWLRLLQESAPETIKCALVGNKCDLLEKRQVMRQEAQTFADEHGLYFLETSAKTGQNIQQVFMDIGSIFVGGPLKQHRHNSAITVTESSEPVTSGKCCG
ncbi:Ras-related protein Rab-5C [Mytilus galloprovincialis]|nr:Ras-related protein Rab-5C [Mytilus galloprovincialis]